VSFYRVFQKLYVLGGLGILCGYARSILRREPRYGGGEFRRFLRRCETRWLLTGKRHASQWNPGENAAGAR